MYDTKCCASVCQIPSSDGKFVRICYFPIMKNYGVGSVDKIFFHENRHVAESGINISGFSPACNGDYMLINELRTQENAIRDYMKMQWQYLKSEKSNNYIGSKVNV